MNTEMTKTYDLEGLKLKVQLRFDEDSGQWFEMLPNLEEQAIFSDQGKPAVCAVQDACSAGLLPAGKRCIDCGSCRYYEPAKPNGLIGLCGNPGRRYHPSEMRLE